MTDNKRILIVDDEPKVAFFLQESLESLGHSYQVVRADSGESALAELNRAEVEVLITDLRMPGISGLELMRRVREKNPQTRLILITAYGSDDVEAETRRLKAYRYFTKPFHIEDLITAVQEALREGNGSGSNSLLLAGERLERARQRLNDLRYETGAQCILLADMAGNVLIQAGLVEGLSPAPLAAIVGSGFGPELEVTRHLREDRSFNLHYHEGARYDVYATNINNPLLLALIFDRRLGASRIGMVWLYTKRAVQDLALIAGDEAAPASDVLSADLLSSLSDKLNSVFGTV